MSEPAFLRTDDLLDRYNISHPTLHRWQQDPDFPKPMRPSGGAKFWRITDLEKWEKLQEGKPSKIGKIHGFKKGWKRAKRKAA